MEDKAVCNTAQQLSNKEWRGKHGGAQVVLGSGILNFCLWLDLSQKAIACVVQTICTILKKKWQEWRFYL